VDSPHLRVLDALRDNRSRWLHARDLALRLDVSQSQLEASLRSLTSDGCQIESHPQLGYRLVSEPGRLVASCLRPEQRTGGIPSEIIIEDSVESTMDSAWALASQGAPHGTAIFAEEQSRGRGRMGRKWVGCRGKALTFSVILRSEEEGDAGHLLVTVAAVAVAGAVRRACGPAAQIKWPNDVVIRERKLGGVLLERRPAAARDTWVLGIGINVNQTPEDFPPALVSHATSIRIECGSPASREFLGRELLAELGVWYGVFERKDLNLVERSWTELSSTMGRRILIREGAKTYSGRVVGLSPLHGLLVQLAPGGLRTFRSEQLSIQVLPD